ncbi:MAG: glycosyl hydrolase family protein [Sphingobacteriales bacterium]|nr:MAG: glycosyl hydrolase family protein [Sphingobacteriales bacterium]
MACATINSFMKRAILLFLLSQGLAAIAHAQCPIPNLDYSNYHVVFEDNFRYPVPPGEDSATSFRHHPDFLKMWQVPSGIGACDGYALGSDDTSQLSMPSHGIVRITVNRTEPYACLFDKSAHVKKHISGRLQTRDPYYVNTGIIEARIKVAPYIPPTTAPYSGKQVAQVAKPAFWVAPKGPDKNSNRNEIDILDNHDGKPDQLWSKVYNFYDDSAAIKQESFIRVNLPDTTCKPHITDLSGRFHIYSCIWTPSRVTFYLDRRYIGHLDFDGTTKPIELMGRTHPAQQEIIINLMANEYTADGQSMEIDWVRYLEQNCNGDSLIISDKVSQSKILPAEDQLGPDMSTHTLENFYYDNILLERKASSLSTHPTHATVLNAGSTTIQGNFIADQSILFSDTIRTEANPRNPHYRTYVPLNGYLEIKPKPCVKATYVDIENDVLIEKVTPTVNKSSLQIYPNPASGDFIIEVQTQGDYAITISDLAGRAVYVAKMLNERKHRVSISSQLASGNYMIQVRGVSFRETGKVTILK